MNSKSVKIDKSNPKVGRQRKFSEDKENLCHLSNKEIKNNLRDDGTTKVRKNRILINQLDQNGKSPRIRKDPSKQFIEETEKRGRQIFSEVDSLKLNHLEETKFDDDKFSTTFSEIDKSENSTCKKSDKSKKDHTRLTEPEKRLEDYFIKRPKTDLSNNYYAIDQWYIYEEFLHPLIPSLSENTETYKNKLIHQNFKKASTQNYKTDSCQTIKFLLRDKGKRNYSEFESLNENDKSSNNLSHQINFLKRRKISSCKKIYESVLIFKDSNCKSHYFKVYNDNETGFDNRYNQILKTMEMDNDVETDDEQLYLARNFTLDNIRDTIKNFNFKLLRNKVRFKRSRTSNPSRRRRF